MPGPNEKPGPRFSMVVVAVILATLIVLGGIIIYAVLHH